MAGTGRRRTIALVGNPNTGKSTLFNRLTGLSQKVGNYPGATVERKAGMLRLLNGQELQVIDLPGTYGLYPQSADEEITAAILQNPKDPDYPDLVIVVADATNLKPSLLVCTQVQDLGLPTILALNMVDMLREDGLTIDEKIISRKLGIPVVRISARGGEGISSLKGLLADIPSVAPPFFRLPEGFSTNLAALQQELGLKTPYAAFQQLLTQSTGAESPAGRYREAMGIRAPTQLVANEIVVRYDGIQELLDQSARHPPTAAVRLTERIDRVLLHPVGGILVLLGVVVLIFQAIFAWASYPMDAIDAGMGSAGSWLLTVLPDSLVTRIFVEGVWAGIQGVVVFVPQIGLLFLFIAVLEESGYLARAGFLMDRLMRPFGLSGRSVIPLFGGFACAIPSIMAARSLPDPRDRIITSMIIPLLSCSARIPVYTVLIAIFMQPAKLWGFFDVRGLVMAAFYLLGSVVALLVALVLKRLIKQKPGTLTGQFFTELPQYRAPRWKNVFIQIFQKVRAFLFEAGKVIVVISIVLWVLATYGPSGKMEAVEAGYEQKIQAAKTTEQREELTRQAGAARLEASYAGSLGRLMEPVLKPLGYDWKIGIALITSFAAREVFVGTMNTLYSVGESPNERATNNRLSERLQAERNPETGKPVYTTAVAISLLVFYALALQCMSTIAVVRRELGGWKWAGILIVYQTSIAYLLAFVAYHLFR